ncbi:hypothetical protein Q7C36_002272 [Tachysurus vachellii]|uniref:Uncharacterized protein n=1 Tax=Tachysurus vachellii TaxID=175792 RepID=A0AA88NU75_TACVA|nr:hypothetical protein Q7C36_002272 [Tachysurus vachellii]
MDTGNLEEPEQVIMAITVTPKPGASTSNSPKNIGIVIEGVEGLLCPTWLDLRAESRLFKVHL